MNSMNSKIKYAFPGLRFIFKSLTIGTMAAVFLTAFFSSAFSKVPKVKERITREEFIGIMAEHQPGNPLLPQNHAQLSKKELYAKTVESLNKQGFNVLDGKKSDVPLKDIEFVTVTYAFTGGPSGKNLLDQKLFLKDAGILLSADIGLVTGVEGKVFQFANGDDTAGRRIELASPVFLNDRVSTGLNSKVSYAFDDGSTLSLGENAEVNITKHIYDPERDLRQTVIKVSLGAVRFVVTKAKAKDSIFEVITPAGIAGVRGTEFTVFVEPTGKTTFVGLEGQIETLPISPTGRPGIPQFVSRGQTQEILPDGTASAVTRASLNLMQKAKKKTTIQQTIFETKGITKAEAEEAAITAEKVRLANEAKKQSEMPEIKPQKPGKDLENVSQAPLNSGPVSGKMG